MKREVVISFIMCTISIVMLIGFTLAWYTNTKELSLTGMDLQAAQETEIKVAKTQGGPDILTLTEEERYITIGLENLNNIKENEIAPGAFGDVTFYITPLQQIITACEIKPMLLITNTSGQEVNEDSLIEAGITEEDKKLYEIANRHIQFYSDEAMMQKVSNTVPMKVDLTSAWDSTKQTGIEKTVKLYWKWDYEYPFTAGGDEGLTEVQKREKVDAYDKEDTELGNGLKTMALRFNIAAVR